MNIQSLELEDYKGDLADPTGALGRPSSRSHLYPTAVLTYRRATVKVRRVMPSNRLAWHLQLFPHGVSIVALNEV